MMRRAGLLLLAVVALLLVCCGGAALLYPSTNTYTVTYRVSGNIPEANITYAGARGPSDRDDQVEEIVQLPWEVTIRRDMLFARRSATLFVSGPPGATLSCEVLINGISAERITGGELVSCGYDEERNPIPAP